MADDRKPRKWSLEEIDELLQDSGMLPRDGDSLDMVEEVAPAQKTEAFDPRPSRNKKIKHNIITEVVEKSDGEAEPQVYGTLGSEKYRQRFNSQASGANAKTMIITEPEEKPDNQKTGKFPLAPDKAKTRHIGVDDKTKILDNDQHTKTIGLRSLAVTDGDAHDIELPVEGEDLQLSFEGFHEEASAQVDERQVEEELERKRREKVSSFTINSEITAEEDDSQRKKYGTDEYRTPDDKFKVQYYLKKKKSSALIGMITSFAISFILLVISLASKGISTGGKGYIIITLILTLIASVVNYEFILDGIRPIKAFRFNRNTGSFISLVAVIIQAVAFLVSPAPFEKGLSLLAASAVMYLGFNVLGEYLEYKRIGENFACIANEENLYSIGYINDKEIAEKIGKGLLQEPVILSSQKTLFPGRFIELSRKYYPSDEISNKTVKIGLIASVIVGIVTLLVQKNILSGITSFTTCCLAAMPYLAFLTDSIALKRVSAGLRQKGAVLSGWQALRLCKKANAIAVDSGDIFAKDGGNVYGIHLFSDIGVDEAIIYAATLAIEAGGPLGNLFKRVIVGETSLLPPTENLIYEDRLGLSAWIFNRRVLVGNEDLLRNHNVEIPDKALVNKHTLPGRYPLYLSIDGTAAAVFIVSYDADEDSKKLLRKIEENNISLLVRATDANVTDISVAEKLVLPQSGVKVISAVSGEIYKSYTKETTSASDSALIHDGKSESFLYAVKSALSLDNIRSVLSTFGACAMGLGVLLVAALSFIGGPQHIGCLEIMILQGLFTGICSGALLLNGRMNKTTLRKPTVKRSRSPRKKKK